MKKILLILVLVLFGAEAVQAQMPKSDNVTNEKVILSNAERKSALRKRVVEQKQALAEKQEKIKKEEEEARLRAEEEARLAAEKAATEAGEIASSANVVVLPATNDSENNSEEIKEDEKEIEVEVETTEDLESAIKSLQEDLKRLQENQNSLQ